MCQPMIPVVIAQGLSDFRTATPQNPDVWHVAIAPGTGISVRVYVGSGVGGAYWALGGGGKLKVPANGDTIYFLNASAGAVSATIVATALRGQAIDWFDVTPGDLA
jgi:hypothetical protein